MLQKVTLFLLFFLFTAHFSPALAQNRDDNSTTPPSDHYFQATVVKINKQGEKEVAGLKNFYQDLECKITNGKERGKAVRVENGGVIKISSRQKLSVGDKVVLIKSVLPDNRQQYSVLDRYRLDSVITIIAAFFFLVLLVAGKKGLGSIVGLFVSLFVIVEFIVPQILSGRDPMVISIIGSTAIMFVTIYLAHGFSKKTSIAIVSTALSLALTGLLALLFVEITRLSGTGSEDSYLLQFGQSSINLQGLLLGGIIIGALGVLDDVTTSQAAAIFEISQANPKLSLLEVAKRGYRVGKEHVASLVNTLVLAYAGASLSLFIIIVLNPANQPYWVILNSEMIIEEVVRTLAGSIGLVMAVPITTMLASYVAVKKR